MSPISAQDKLLPVFHFNHLTTADGLPSNEIRSNVVTDRQGFIWIGTVLGLARYDGYSCKVYRHIPGDPHSLSSDGIMSLALDRRGFLWVGTWDTGLSLYDAPNDRFVNFLPRGKDSTLQGVKAILMIHEDRAGNIWCSSYDNKVVFADMSDLMDETNADSIAARVRFRLLHVEGSKETVYLGDWDQQTLLFGTSRGLFTCDRSNLQVQCLHLTPASGVNLDTVKTAAFWWGSDDRLWIATRSHGLFLFDRSKGSLASFHKRPRGAKEPRDDLITDAVIDRGGRLWMPTPTTLDLFDPATGAYAEYLTLPFNTPRHPNYVSTDRLGRLWVSTMDDGLYFLTPGSFRFPQCALRGTEGKPKAMETIHEAGNGTYWISTEGTVARVEIAGLKVLQTVDLFGGQTPTYWRAGVMDSYRDRRGTIWYSTWGLGLYKFEPGTARVANFRTSRQLAGLANKEDVCWNIAGGNGDSLWVAGNRDGLLQFNIRTGRFSRRPLVGGPDLVNVTHVLNDIGGRIWITDEQQGVSVLDPSTNIVEHFRHDPDRPTSIADDRGRYAYQDPGGRIWIGTKELSLWDPPTRSFTRYPNGAFRDPAYVMPLQTDPQGRLWTYFYPGGLGVLDPVSRSFTNFVPSDGLCPNIYGMSLLPDGRVLLLGWGGMNVVQPESLSSAQPPPPLVLTRMSINDSVIVSAWNLAASDLLLRHDQNVLEFEFAAIDPGAGQLIEYRYQLEGLEDTWIKPGLRRFVRYPGLTPGKYVFRVKAVSKLGRWPDRETALVLTIDPPWWRAWWAYLAYGLLGVGLLATVYRIRLRQLHLRQQIEMEHFQAERLAEVDRLKSRFFANISHEFRTPLTLILGPADQGLETKDADTKDQKFLLIKESARRLLGLVNQVLDFSRLESGVMRLQVSRGDIVQFLRRAVMSFESWAERKKIELVFRSECESIEGFLDRDKFEKIINNLMSNALKFTPEGGAVSVSLRVAPRNDGPQGNDIEISVSDTGPGIPAEHLPRIFDRFYRVDVAHSTEGSGIGLALTKELVELHHGSIGVVSTHGKGTIFTLTLPVDESAYRREEIAVTSFQGEKTGSAEVITFETSADIPAAAPGMENPSFSS